MRGARKARLLAHGMAAAVGIDLVRYSGVGHSIGRRVRLMSFLKTDLVLDVGANVGQFALELRRHGYAGRIVSFEPLAEPYAVLARRTSKDGSWQALNFALGDVARVDVMNVSQNSASSSLLDMLEACRRAAPSAAYIGRESVEIRRLDEIADGLLGTSRRPYLKMDVQGYELAVLQGAGDLLKSFAALQIELAFAPLYAGAPLAEEVMSFVQEAGFTLAGFEPGFAEPVSGQLLEGDGIFVRRGLLPVSLSAEL